jgi:ABC-type uncharacterized transport system substrate-binding protein
MRRREFVGLAGGMAAAWPLAARAQPNMPRLGVLMIVAENDADSRRRIAAFQQGLRDHGWEDGRNIRIDYRWAASQPELIGRYVAELVALNPNVIFANGTTVTQELQRLTRSIPIVCALLIDPVSFGFVDSLSNPGGNITGFSFISAELIGKWTALIKDTAPGVMRAVLLYNPKITPFYPHFLRKIAAAPQSVAMELVPATVETVDDLPATVEALARTPGTSLIVGPDAFMLVHIDKVARLAAQHRLPGVSVYRQFVIEGGLLSYGPDTTDIFRRSADYIDRILNGAKPAELPVQQPAKFECVVSRKAADALGIELPPSLLALADEVIE